MSILPIQHLDYTLEKRKELIDTHLEEMDYVCSLIPQYIKDVKHAITMKYSPSIISHLTYNLALCIADSLLGMTIYEYVSAAYLLQDDYDRIHKLWCIVNDNKTDFFNLLNNLKKANIFNSDENGELVVDDLRPESIKKYCSISALINLQRQLSSINGDGLLNCLFYYVKSLYNWLYSAKNGIYELEDGDYEIIYQANFELYRNEYWPRDGTSFRTHIIERNINRAVTRASLEKLLWQEQNDFETNPIGRLWRDYLGDKKTFYIEAKRIGIDEDQWKYYFKSVCRFEEYKHWIEELEHPEITQKGLKKYVIKPEIADAVVNRITGLIGYEEKPKNIMRPIRAAMDAGVLHRPSWDAFTYEYGEDKIKSSTSFNDYTNPDKQPYYGESYQTLVDDFKTYLE